MGYGKIANNAWATTASAIVAGDRTIAVNSGQGQRFPATDSGDWFYITLITSTGALEVARVVTRNGDIFTEVDRGVDGTIPLDFPAGSALEARFEQSLWNIDMLTFFMARDGQSAATADLDMGGFAVKNGKDPVNPQDFVTKAYVDAQLLLAMPHGGIIIWGNATIPPGWQIADGTNGTVDMRDRFTVGAGNGYAVLSVGGCCDRRARPDADAEPPARRQHGRTGLAWPRRERRCAGQPRSQHAEERLGTGGQRQRGMPIGTDQPAYSTVRNPLNTNAGGLHAHNIYIAGDGNHAHNIATDFRGGNQPHENRPPYIAMFYIERMPLTGG